MLRKLMKQEFRATGRIMLPLYGIILLLSVCANGCIRLLDSTDSTVLDIFSGIIMTAYGVGIMAVCIVTLVLMINRFRTNLLGDEGYVMFTLPASVHEQIWSKLIVSSVWFVASGIVVILAVMLATFRVDFMVDAFRWIGQLLDQITAYYAVNGAAILAELLVLVFLICGGCCLEFYAAMAVGHSFSGHKSILSVGFFLLFQFVLQFTGMSGLMGINNLDFLQNLDLSVMSAIHAVMGMTIAVTLIVGAVFYFLTAYMLKKRLNLE